MVNISHDDYFSSSTMKGKELSPEDVQERIQTYNPYNVKDLKYIDLSDPVHDFRKNIPPFNSRPEYYGGKDSAYEVFNVLEAWKLDKIFI